MRKIKRSHNSTLRQVSLKKQNIGGVLNDIVGILAVHQALKRTRIKPVSDKRKVQNAKEKNLRPEMLAKCDFTCQFCGANYERNVTNLGKHEIVFRSHWAAGALVKDNCIILCWINKTSDPWTLGCH